MKINHGLYNEQNEKRLRTNSNSKKIRVKKRRKLLQDEYVNGRRATLVCGMLYFHFIQTSTDST